MPDTTVIYASSAYSGAPQLTGQAGSLIAVLDAVLVNGWGAVTLDSLVVSGGIATGTKSTGHGFALIGGELGAVIEISGATPSGLNGRWRIASVPGTTQFTFACPGVVNGTATGTIVAKRGAAGWSQAFSGTNKAAYRSPVLGATGMYWRIEDSTAQYASSSAYETMSDVDEGTSFATGRFVIKSNTADATARNWAIVANASMVYVFVDTSSTNYWEPHFFGDISAIGVDSYRCLLAGTINSGSRANSANFIRYVSTNATNWSNYIVGRLTLARRYTGVAGGVSASLMAMQCLTFLSDTGTSDGYPHVVTGGAVLDPINVYQGPVSNGGGGVLRGVLPGAFSMRASLRGALGAFVLPGERLYVGFCIGHASSDSGAGNIILDVQGPWG